MSGRKRQVEIEERISFVVDRIRMGISKAEIVRQIGSRFGLSETQSRIWYHKANDSLISIDKEQRPKIRVSMIEIIRSQLIGLQQDIGKLSVEIQSYEDNKATRETIQAQLVNADDREREQLKRELAAVRPLKPRYYLDILSQRSRIRMIRDKLSFNRNCPCRFGDRPIDQSITCSRIKNICTSIELSDSIATFSLFISQIHHIWYLTFDRKP